MGRGSAWEAPVTPNLGENGPTIHSSFTPRLSLSVEEDFALFGKGPQICSKYCKILFDDEWGDVAGNFD